MNLKYLIYLLVLIKFTFINTQYDWAIIGAGPAGIITVGKLIDAGISPQKIVWIDPEFKVGDFGTKWQNISSNTKIALFEKFYQSCKSFGYIGKTEIFEIDNLNKQDTCQLKLAAEPLEFITQNLKKQVVCIEDYVSDISKDDKAQKLILKNKKSILAKNIVLCIGSEPKTLNFKNLSEVDLKIVFDDNLLPEYIKSEDTVAVFGSSHSAVIVLQKLVDLKVKKIINFYKEPIKYAVYFDDWTLFNDTGLKGKTAIWAKENLSGKLPQNLVRYISDEKNIEKYLPECNKVVYAIGFERRHISIEGLETNFKYNTHYGIIAPGLFGLGIAFPELKVDKFNNPEYRVGIYKFMDYLNQVLPIWLKYSLD